MKKIIWGLSIAFSIIALTACGSNEAENMQRGSRTVRINECGVYVACTSIVMKEKGILEKYLPDDVDVEWSQIATGPDIRDAVLSGNVDIADMSLMTFILANEQDLPLSVFSFSGSTPVYVYSNDGSINTLSDFSATDKISITNKSTNLHIAFLGLCKKELGNALSLDGCLTAIPAADAIASLKAGQEYAGAVFSFPMSNQADAMDNLTLLYDTSDLVAEYSIGSAMVASTDFYKNNPDIIEAFLKAQEEAINFIVDNPDEAAIVLKAYFNCDEEFIVETIKTMPPTNKIAGYDKQAELLYEVGILSDEPEKFEELWNYDQIVK